MKTQIFTLLCLLGICAYSVAQEQPNSAEWHARHNPSSPYNPNNRGQQLSPQGRWETRWGAVSVAKDGWIGTSVGMPSKRAAKKAALLNCKEKKGQGCEIYTTYSNQCIAMATGEDLNAVKAEESYFWATRFDKAIEVAIDSATEECSKKSQKCEVIYSECSLPELVQ